MHDLTHIQFDRQHREELMREAEMNRLAKEARGGREKRSGHRRTSEPVQIVGETRRSSPQGPRTQEERRAERDPS